MNSITYNENYSLIRSFKNDRKGSCEHNVFKKHILWCINDFILYIDAEYNQYIMGMLEFKKEM